MNRKSALLEAGWFGLVCFAALWLAAMAAWDAFFGEPTCASGGCLTVQTSPWARPFGGPPLSFWGAALLGLLAARAAWLQARGKSPWTDEACLAMQGGAVAAAIAATAYAGFALRAACADCLVAAGAIALSGFLFGVATLAGAAPSEVRLAPLALGLCLATLPVAAVRGAAWRDRMLMERRFEAEALPETRRPDALVWGRKDAGRTMVAFLDFRCWACHLLLRQARRPVRDGRLRLIVLHAPLHSDTDLAQVAHAAALEGRFDELLARLDEAGSPAHNPWDWAEERWPGLRARRERAAEAAVARQGELARRLGIVQTPTVFVLGPEGRFQRRPWLECLPSPEPSPESVRTLGEAKG